MIEIVVGYPTQMYRLTPDSDALEDTALAEDDREGDGGKARGGAAVCGDDCDVTQESSPPRAVRAGSSARIGAARWHRDAAAPRALTAHSPPH